MVVSVVLERNPELEFSDKVDLDVLVKEAFSDFQKDRGCLDGAVKQVENVLVLTRLFGASAVNHQIFASLCHVDSLKNKRPRMTWKRSTTRRLWGREARPAT